MAADHVSENRQLCVHTVFWSLESMVRILAAKIFSGEVQRREAGIGLGIFEFQIFWFCIQQLESTLGRYARLAPRCEQSLSKTDQRASKRGSAEIVWSLLSRRRRFWASHSGQTGWGSARVIFLTRRRSKLSLQCENQYGIRSAIRTIWVWNCVQATACAYDLTRFLQSPFFLVEALTH